MIAETVYTVAQALPPTELQRLFDMLKDDLRKNTAKPVKQRKPDPVWTLEYFINTVAKQFNDKKARRIALREAEENTTGKQLSAPPGVASECYPNQRPSEMPMNARKTDEATPSNPIQPIPQ